MYAYNIFSEILDCYLFHMFLNSLEDLLLAGVLFLLFTCILALALVGMQIPEICEETAFPYTWQCHQRMFLSEACMTKLPTGEATHMLFTTHSRIILDTLDSTTSCSGCTTGTGTASGFIIIYVFVCMMWVVI